MRKDILIIGGGLGGLICGILLQKNNFNVSIAEKNKRVGGLLQNFKRKGCTFDVGMHYIGSAEKGQIVYKILKYLNIYDKISLHEMDTSGYEVFKIQDKTYTFPKGWEAFKNRLSEYFPNEKVAIVKYAETVQEASNSFDIINLRYPVSLNFGKNKFAETGIYDFIDELTGNDELKRVLSLMNSMYAGQKDKASLYTHAVIHNHYSQSSMKIEGGGEEIANALENEFVSHGGKIFVNEFIHKFETKDGLIESALSKSGHKFKADYFISGFHPSLTIDMIEGNYLRKPYRKRMQQLENTISTFSIHLVLKKPTFQNFNFNFHRYLQDEVWGADSYHPDTWPQSYLIYTPYNRESTTKCLSVFTFMSYSEVKKWENATNESHTESYKQWKEQRAQKLLKVVEKDFPEIIGNIDDMEVLTPLSYKDYLNNKQGECYGIVHDYKEVLKSLVLTKTQISNLYFTGQNVNMHGFLGVSIGSLLTAGNFIDINNLVKSISEQE
ncbi:phytoene desaturase family protein [Maribellus mangrovi]|uniref:phytoene desaturase family protein n=1 Tax=Maribellus mangrovi TaxID=3133146 RepID=UPI0030EC9543